MRSFSFLRGAVRGLVSLSRAKICARELGSVASRLPPGVPRGLPWPPVHDGTDDIYSSKVSNTTLGPKLQCLSVPTIKPPFPNAQTVPHGYRHLQELFYRLRGSRAQKEQLPETKMLGFAAYAILEVHI